MVVTFGELTFRFVIIEEDISVLIKSGGSVSLWKFEENGRRAEKFIQNDASVFAKYCYFVSVDQNGSHGGPGNSDEAINAVF